MLRDQIEFFRQFRKRFETTGAIAPSSRFLAKAMTEPLRGRTEPARILEIGPGTGAVTRNIVRLLEADDHFDLVEVNEKFAAMLNQRFQQDRLYQPAAEQSQVHVCGLEEFQPNGEYDFIISSLPLNNFPADLVSEVFKIYFQLLAPGAILSYFEYMYVRPFRKLISGRLERSRLEALAEIMRPYLARHRFSRSWVFVNVPPAWVQHLQNDVERSEATIGEESVAEHE